jgi:hypothetical protein
MTDHFDNLYKCVEGYYNEQLSQNVALDIIIDTFREDPLPRDLLNCGFDNKEIKRFGQIVATKFVINDNKQKAAKLPESDILNTIHN